MMKDEVAQEISQRTSYAVRRDVHDVDKKEEAKAVVAAASFLYIAYVTAKIKEARLTTAFKRFPRCI